MIYYKIQKFKSLKKTILLPVIENYNNEIFVTLEDAKDEFVKVKKGCRQEKLLDSNKSFQIEIWRYDDENSNYEEMIEREFI